jgi:hypothetical protein
MTREDKFKIIVDKLGDAAAEFQSIHLSVLILMGYMETLFKNGIIHESPVETTEIGKQALTLCDEYNWNPSDTEIVEFCQNMVDKSQLESFVIMLREMRDNQEKFLENAKKHIGY